MNSKIICTVLTGALTLTLFTGCGTEDGLDTMESNLQTETESETYDPEMAEIQNEMSSQKKQYGRTRNQNKTSCQWTRVATK